MTPSAKLNSLRESGKKGLILFFTAGDQPLSELPRIVSTLEKAGADVIEIGIPFSDPFGEGPTIQLSSQRSLESGATTKLILDSISKVSVSIPLVTMGYFNPVLRFGLKNFASESQKAGLTGSIISDLVPDEADAWCKEAADHNQETIFLVAPTSTKDRIQEVCSRTTGFVYAVSRTGVTGTESSVPEDVSVLVDKIRAKTDKPIAVGFGISTAEHVKLVHEVADAAVVGSALVKLLNECWGKPGDEAIICEFVHSLRS